MFIPFDAPPISKLRRLHDITTRARPRLDPAWRPPPDRPPQRIPHVRATTAALRGCISTSRANGRGASCAARAWTHMPARACARAQPERNARSVQFARAPRPHAARRLLVVWSVGSSIFIKHGRLPAERSRSDPPDAPNSRRARLPWLLSAAAIRNCCCCQRLQALRNCPTAAAMSCSLELPCCCRLLLSATAGGSEFCRVNFWKRMWVR